MHCDKVAGQSGNRTRGVQQDTGPEQRFNQLSRELRQENAAKPSE